MQKPCLNVFYLDDEDLLLMAFADRFSTSEINVKTFDKYEEFALAIKQHMPDVVVLDYTMPGKNGEEIAMALPPHIHKILVTGNLSHNQNPIFEHVFTKPFDEEKIEKYFASKLQLKK